MLFLIAMRNLLAFEMPRQYIRDTMTDIVQTMYVKPVEDALASATEAEKAHLEQKLHGWKELLDNNIFIKTTQQILPATPNEAYEDYIVNAVVALWATRDNLTTKVDPFKGMPKDLVNWFRAHMSGKIKDQVRHDLGRGEKTKKPKTVSLDAPHGDDKGTRILDYIENHHAAPDRETHGELEHMKHQFMSYVKSKDKSGMLQKLAEVWMHEIDNNVEIPFAKIAPQLEAAFDISEQRAYQLFQEYKQIAADFWRHELGITIDERTKKILKIANNNGYIKVASKLAMEVQLAHEQFRKAAARYVLGGVYSDLMSGDYMSPEAMVEEVRS